MEGSEAAPFGAGSRCVFRISPRRAIDSLRLLKVLPDLSQTKHRLANPRRQHIEGHQLADGESALDHQPGAEIKRSTRCNLAD